nr:phage Gp37/Gp68 family protein [Burkholderia glumae]
MVDQAEADRDIPKLLTIRASVRFLSIEPMLGHINLRRHLAWPNHYGLDCRSSTGTASVSIG